MRRDDLGTVFLALLLVAPAHSQVAPTPSPAPSPAAVQNYLQLPLAFERQGHGAAEYYVARGQGYAIGINGGNVNVDLASPPDSGKTARSVTLEFAGSRTPNATPGAELRGKVNYIQGNDPKHWQLDLPTYDRVTWPELYPGIDVVYYGNQQLLEFDLVVKPGADPRNIRMKVGGGPISLNGSGALVIGNTQGDLRIQLPRIYQRFDGANKQVAGHFALRGPDEVGFEVDAYDRTRPLVIDPVLNEGITLSTLLGGSTDNTAGRGIALDSSGNIYVAGFTSALDFPTVNPVQSGTSGTPDGFITKINPAGTAFIYSTYIGGSNIDQFLGVAVDSTGAAWATGFTASSDFPLMSPVQSTLTGTQDAVVVKLNPSGALAFSTYLGGNATTTGEAIAIDGTNNAYVTGFSNSTNFPVTSEVIQTANQGSSDIFVTKYSSTGARSYSTLLGGSGSDQGFGIAVDSGGDAYVTGSTNSANLSTESAAQSSLGGGVDAFVAKINSDATQLLYFTYLGGTGAEQGNVIAVDSDGNAYIGGQSSSTGLATEGVVQTSLSHGNDGLVAKLNGTGTSFTYITYLGGSRNDQIFGLALDGTGSVYVTGETQSTDFPTAHPFQAAFEGNSTSLFQSTNSGAAWTALDGNIPGTVLDVSPDPITSGTIVAASDQGIYRTTNGGTSWTQELPGTFGALYLARSLVTPSTIYLAQGNGGTRISTDNGITWTAKGTAGSANGIVADGANAGTAYVFGNGSGVFVTTNSGSNWTAADTGLPSRSVIAMAAGTDGNVYAALQSGGIYKSTNHGTSWSPINNGVPSGFPGPHSLGVSQDNPSLLFFASNQTGQVYYSLDGGADWSAGPDFPGGNAVEVSNLPSGATTLYATAYDDNGGAAAVYSLLVGSSSAAWTLMDASLATSGIAALIVDPLNNAHLFAVTSVPNSAFVAKLGATGSTLLYSTYLSGIGNAVGESITANGAGQVYVTGLQSDDGFPIVSPNLQPSGNQQAFVTVIADNPGPCAYSVGQLQSFGQNNGAMALNGSGGSGQIGVSAPGGCAWTAVSDQSWLTGTPASGSGSGIVSVQIAANTTGSARTAHVTIAGQNATIIQADSSCSWNVDQNPYFVPQGGGTVTVNVTAGSGCPWDIENDAPSAITVNSGSPGIGNGTITLSVAPNGSLNQRDFNVSSDTLSINITQFGVCVYRLGSSNATVISGGTSSSVGFTTSAPACSLFPAIFSNVSWITYSGNSGSVSYTVAPNTGTARSGQLTIGGAVFTINQNGAAPQTITFGPLSSVGLGTGPVTLNATASSSLQVSYASNSSLVCSVTGNQVTLLTAGTCSITASQLGNTTYMPAAPVTQTFTVYPALSVTTPSLPGGYVGLIYGPATMAAAGGSGNYSWSVSGGPASFVMTTAGFLNSTAPLTTTAIGTYSVVTVVTDTITNATASRTFSVVITPALSITTSALPNGFAGSTYGPVTMSATGGSGTYSWAVTGAPPGVTMTAAGVLSSTAPLAPAAAGSYPSVTVILTDASSNVSTSRTYAVSVAFAQLTLSGSANLGGFAPSAGISATYSASGGAAPYTWSTPQGLPTGLMLSPAGALTGSITQPGNYSFQVKVSDSQTVAATASLNVSLFVLGISTTSLPSGSVNVAYTQTLGVIGGAPPYTWSVTAGTPPAGLRLTNAGVLTGTPTASGVTTPFTVSVTSGGVTVSQPLSLTVTATPLPLSIPGGGGATPVPLTGGTLFVPYSQTLQAIHGQPPYSWQMIGGALPVGLSLASSGTLAGTPMPSVTPAQTGTFAFTAQVTDTSGSMVASAFAITIAAPSLSFTTGSPLPTGIAGSSYPPQVVTATGGIPPYTFTAAASESPSARAVSVVQDGLTFSNGQISGTPTSAGVFAFVVTVSDSSQPALTTTESFQISVEPAHADLILSQTSIAFALSAGASGLPAGASVTLESSFVQQPLSYSVAVMPAVPWLDVTGGGSTPGAIAVNLDPSALNLSPGMNQTTLVVTCIAPSPCVGNSQNINVTLTVSAPPPQLSIGTNLLSFSAQSANPQPVSQTMGLQNVGGGAIAVNSITAADAFVNITGIPAAIPAGPAIPVTVTVNPAGLAAGYYQSAIFVDTSAGSANVPVTLLLAENPIMTLNPAGSQFQMPAGTAPGNPNGSFLVSVAGGSTVNWTAAVQPGAGWLTLNTPTGTSTSASPGSVGFTINATAATLAPQAYYGLIQVASADVDNSPQSFVVVLNVVPATNTAIPNPQPSGLLFIAAGSPLAAQTVQLFASSTSGLSYQASSDSSWLQVAPATGLTSAASPASSSVSVNLSGLAAGVYRGSVSYAFSSAAVRTVNVTLIVEAGAVAPSDRTDGTKALPRITCAPSQLVPTQTGLVNNFSQPASWPTPLAVLLVDDCGNSIESGQVVATFTNGDPPLALGPTGTTSAIYSGTWTPRNTSGQVTIAARATAPGFQPATVQITGQVRPNAAPILNHNGTLDAFAIAAEPGVPVAPGTIVQIYGSNLASQITSASTIPLPTSLNQTSVAIGGLLAPLYFVSPGQINAQVPFELTPGQAYQVIISANGALSTPDSIQLAAAAPGVAQFATGEIIAQHGDGSLVLETSPAAPGEYIVMYVAGMGLTSQTVLSGTASPYPATALAPTTLTLNGAPVPNVIFAGLTPTLVGLYQINFQVPPNTPAGALQLVVSQTGGPSASTILPVHP